MLAKEHITGVGSHSLIRSRHTAVDHFENVNENIQFNSLGDDQPVLRVQTGVTCSNLMVPVNPCMFT